MSNLAKRHTIRHRQQGAALFIGLVFLVLLTLIGLYAARTSSLQLRMAGNAGAKAVSFENSEDSRLDAENIVSQIADSMSTAGGNDSDFNCGTLGVGHFARAGAGATGCNTMDSATLEWDDTDSTINPDNSYGRYAIEYMGQDQVDEIGDDVETGTGGITKIDVFVFRVLGRGNEGSGATSTVETIFIARKS